MQVVERKRGALGVFIWKMGAINPTSQDELGGFEHIVGASLSLSSPSVSHTYTQTHTDACII